MAFETKESTRDTWYCGDCGSSDLSENVWVSVNEDFVIDGECYVKYEDEVGDGTNHSNKCEESICYITRNPKEEK